MNFALIPFFLAANIVTDNPNEWTYGPEYVFHVNVTHLLSTDLAEEPFFTTNMTMIMRCRPEAAEKLHCRYGNVVIEVPDDQPTPKTEIKHGFLIEFSPRGIENLRFPEIVDHNILNIIRNIVKELSIGANLNENANSLPEFVQKTNYVLGECDTLFRISEYDKVENCLINDQEEERNYNLVILSFPKRQSDSIVEIEKRMVPKRCVKPEHPFTLKQYIGVNISQSLTKIHIGDNIFRSKTERRATVKKSPILKDFIVQDITCMELLAIEPAEELLPFVDFNVVAPLYFY